MTDILRIANCSGFYGDRLSAAREMVEGGPIDVLTGDYLAELTLMILLKDRLKDPSARLRAHLPPPARGGRRHAATQRGIKIVVNAGGLNPAGCAEAARALYKRARRRTRWSRTSRATTSCRSSTTLQAAGETLAPPRPRPCRSRALDAPVLSANAYLGGWGIVAALERGADLVICPRVTDAALTLGPAAWKFGWKRDDWDRLAAGVVAGHIIECGAQSHRRQLRLLQGGARPARIPASRSPRCAPTAASSSPSTRAPAASCRSAR